MSVSRLSRPVFLLTAAALGLAGCVAPPPPVPPGSVLMSQSCLAGFYQCRLAEAGPVGSPCACPGLGAPSYGTIR